MSKKELKEYLKTLKEDKPFRTYIRWDDGIKQRLKQLTKQYDWNEDPDNIIPKRDKQEALEYIAVHGSKNFIKHILSRAGEDYEDYDPEGVRAIETINDIEKFLFSKTKRKSRKRKSRKRKSRKRNHS